MRSVEWGKFRLGELFSIEGNKSLDKGELTFSHNKDLYPYFTRTVQDNGVIGYVESHESVPPTEGNCLVIGMMAMRAFYLNRPFYSGQYTKRAVPKGFNLTKQTAQFFLSVIRPLEEIFKDGTVGQFKDRFESCEVELPVRDGNVDFESMEKIVSLIEQEKLKLVRDFLVENGLDDPKLSPDEENALKETHSFVWKPYKIGDLFEKVKTDKLSYKAKNLPTEPTRSSPLPLLTSSFQNQGLNYFAPRKGATILKGLISIPSNSDVYRAYYQPREFSVLSDAYAIRWRGESVLSPAQSLFFVTCINMVTDLSIYSYKNKLGGWNTVQKKEIQLPVISEDRHEIDFRAMDLLIRALEKLRIRGIRSFLESEAALDAGN